MKNSNKSSYKKRSYKKRSYKKRSYKKRSYKKRSYKKRSYNKKSYKIGGNRCNNVIYKRYDLNVNTLEKETKNSSNDITYFAIVKNPYVMSKETFYKNIGRRDANYDDIDTSPGNMTVYCLNRVQLGNVIKSSNNNHRLLPRLGIMTYNLLNHITGSDGYIIINDKTIYPYIKKFNILVKVENLDNNIISFYHLIKSYNEIPPEYQHQQIDTILEKIKEKNEVKKEKIKEKNRVEIEKISASHESAKEKIRNETRAKKEKIRAINEALLDAEEIRERNPRLPPLLA
jgi:hypothetical protein